jgi:hypothetical protein
MWVEHHSAAPIKISRETEEDADRAIGLHGVGVLL